LSGEWIYKGFGIDGDQVAFAMESPTGARVSVQWPMNENDQEEVADFINRMEPRVLEHLTSETSSFEPSGGNGFKADEG
jgi:hypothetical protein